MLANYKVPTPRLMPCLSCGIYDDICLGCNSGCPDKCECKKTQECVHCEDVCPGRTDLSIWHQAAPIDILSYKPIKQLALKTSLPLFLPQIPSGVIGPKISKPLVALGIKELVDKSGSKLLVTKKTLYKKFNLVSSSQIVIVCFARDDLIEKLWSHNRKKVFREIASLKPLAVITPDYSLFHDLSRRSGVPPIQ